MLSIGEITSGCKMAMRGGGCQWGMAEESGNAAGWLAHNGLFRPAAFAEVIGERPRLSPPQDAGKLSPRRGFGAQCPVCLGAFLSDNIAALASGGALAKPLLLRKVKSPLLVAACLPDAARALKTGILLSWRGGGIMLLPPNVVGNKGNNAGGAAFYGDVHNAFAPVAKLQTANAAQITKIAATMAKTNRAQWQSPDAPSRIPANDGNWQKLMHRAKKTMVASTQTSAIKGAGAGLTDND